MSEAISVHHGDFGRAAIYQLSKPITTHAHREGHLIFYIGGGTAKVPVGGTEFAIHSGQAVGVSPWESHAFELDDPNDPCLCLVLYIKPIWFVEAGRCADYGLSFGGPGIDLNAELVSWVSRLTTLLMEEESSDLFDRYLFETASRCYDESWRGTKEGSAVTLARSKFSDFRVRRSLKIMRENFADEVDIEWLAREAGLSRPHFFKLFKKQMGITPNLYLNTLRSEQAIEDLMTTSKSVTEISYDLGFSSQASFTRFFTSNVGIPPSDYRRVAHVS